MNFNEITEEYLKKTNKNYDRKNGVLALPVAAGELTIELRLSADEKGTLFANAKLPAEILPRETEEVIVAVNSANALSNYGGFALSPADQSVTFRGYVRLRGDVESEIGYLLEKSEKTLCKFAPALCSVCEGKLSADEFMSARNKIIGQ